MLRKPLLCLVLLLIGTLRLPAQTTPAPAEPPKSSSIIVPFAKMNGPTNCTSLNVMIHGKGPYRFTLDTGAYTSLITPDLAAELGIRSTSAGKVYAFQNKRVTVGIAKLDRIQLGGASIENLQCCIAPLPTGDPDRGILGADVFKKYIVTVDYAFRLVTLSDPKTFTYLGRGLPLPLVFETGYSIPIITGGVDGLPASLEVDTGYNGALLLLGGFVKANSLKSKYTSGLRTILYETMTGEEQSKVTREPTLTLGKNILLQVPTELQEPDVASRLSGSGVIGADILRRFIVTFDYSHLRAWFEPNGSFAALYPTNRSGFVAHYEISSYIVRVVEARSPAATAGLKVGDRILKIDGKDAAQVASLPFRGLTCQPAGTKLRLTVQSGKKTREVTLILKDYD